MNGLPIALWLSILAVSWLYIPLNKRTPKSYIESRWDKYIPLIPPWVYIYISYYFFATFACIVLPLNTTYGTAFTISFVIGTLIADFIWYFHPTGVKRPILDGIYTLHHKLLHHLYTHDGDANAVPSGHVLHTIICAYYAGIIFPQFALVIWLWAIAICLSTVLVKQHYIVDVPTGVIVGLIASVVGSLIA